MDNIINENENQPSTTKQKLENFWYYYKNYVISILFLAIVIFSYFYSTIFEPSPDGTITIIAQPYFYDASDYMSETWSSFAVDLNDDGKTYVKVIPIQSDPFGDFGMDSTMYQAANLTVTSHINSANNFLLLLDEVNYFLLKEQGVQFVDLSQYSTSLKHDNEMYILKDTNLAESLGFTVFDVLFFALIDFSSLKPDMQADKVKLQSFEYDLSLLQTLIKAN